jgi:hypothetical protein
MPSTTIKWLWSADLKLMCEAMTPIRTIANSGKATFFFIFGVSEGCAWVHYC